MCLSKHRWNSTVSATQNKASRTSLCSSSLLQRYDRLIMLPLSRFRSGACPCVVVPGLCLYASSPSLRVFFPTSSCCTICFHDTATSLPHQRSNTLSRYSYLCTSVPTRCPVMVTCTPSTYPTWLYWTSSYASIPTLRMYINRLSSRGQSSA